MKFWMRDIRGPPYNFQISRFKKLESTLVINRPSTKGPWGFNWHSGERSMSYQMSGRHFYTFFVTYLVNW